MNILIGCEYSGVVRDQFTALGHNAWSCDLLPTEAPGQHYQGDLRDLLNEAWDLAVFHPPCTHLAVSGTQSFRAKLRDGRMIEALNFVRTLMACPIPRWCLENPVSIISTVIKQPSQIIQPWQFGHGATKATCLWLHNLPLLRPTHTVEGRDKTLHNLPPSADRGKLRSRTYPGIAEAMAWQWAGPASVVIDNAP